MKAINILIALIIGITTITTAQEADSIVVTYDNQRTIIPVPSFGKQTTIKMADTVQVIEIGVSRRKISDFVQASTISSTTTASGKPLKKTKWYSQIEAGYVLKLVPGPSSETAIINSEPATIHYNTDDMHGYKIGISVYEKERLIANKFSYVNGFKLGFSQYFKAGKNSPINQDTILDIYIGYTPVTVSCLQFIFPFGFKKMIGSGESNTMFNFGLSVGSSIVLNRIGGFRGNTTYGGSPFFLQPFLGFEKGKYGILASADLLFGTSYDYSVSKAVFNIAYGIGFSFTYRLF